MDKGSLQRRDEDRRGMQCCPAGEALQAPGHEALLVAPWVDRIEVHKGKIDSAACGRGAGGEDGCQISAEP